MVESEMSFQLYGHGSWSGPCFSHDRTAALHSNLCHALPAMQVMPMLSPACIRACPHRSHPPEGHE